jgi:hypothetical protein
MTRRGPVSKRRSMKPPHSLKAVPPPGTQDTLRPPKSQPTAHGSIEAPPHAPSATSNGGAQWSELMSELKQIRRLLVGNDAVPTHEDAFRNVLDKLLESAWPTNNNNRKRKPNEVDADDVDRFQQKIEKIGKVLEPWIALRSWFLERGELWQTWVDVPPQPYDPRDWAAIVADARQATAGDPKREIDALEALIGFY